MGNKRIYEVAKDYGKPVNEVIDLLKKNNIEKTNFSAADDKAMSVTVSYTHLTLPTT